MMKITIEENDINIVAVRHDDGTWGSRCISYGEVVKTIVPSDKDMAKLIELFIFGKELTQPA